MEKGFSACVRLIIVGAKRVGTLDANKFLKSERNLIWKSSNSNQSIKNSAFNGLCSAEFLISANVSSDLISFGGVRFHSFLVKMLS